ncbi:MAG: glutamine--fructose-6-phosphate transaminase (isomerizing) [Simkaniaceae bacterium]|nr:glutamine--fructose-6-phosphate transaminase (isomerizing) [Simkaniaceae bacterium]
MCGIFAYVGPKSSVRMCLEGLKKLEYRGYDSSGIAGFKGNKLSRLRRSGKLAALEKACEAYELDIAISHTRWATHGKPSEQNAHPHVDLLETLALVHNGIIENYEELFHTFKFPRISDTDTEVLTHLAAHFYKGSLKEMMQNMLSHLKGTYAVALIHKDHPDTLIVAAQGSPLAIGMNETEVFISSDPNTFSDPTLKIYFLGDGEFALLKKGNLQIYDKLAQGISKDAQFFPTDHSLISKGLFPHYMLKEIHEQAEAVQRTLFYRKKIDFTEVKQISIIGCGSSYHAGLIAASLFEQSLGIPCHAYVASEFRYKHPVTVEDHLLIAISQSGETADTLAALTGASKTLGICNVQHSTLARSVDTCLFLEAGREVSVCSTKAFSCQLALLASLVLEDLSQLPILINQVLSLEQDIRSIAKKYQIFDDIIFIGRQEMFPSAMEAALKLKEITYLNANAYPAGELKHGPIALINSQLLTIALLGNHRTFDKTISNLKEIQARGGPILAFAPKGSSVEADDTIYLPVLSDELSPILYAVATQLFAYHMAVLRGTDIDQPRNLAKSVTVE